jgi:hypothetical protein
MKEMLDTINSIQQQDMLPLSTSVDQASSSNNKTTSVQGDLFAGAAGAAARSYSNSRRTTNSREPVHYIQLKINYHLHQL